MLQRLIRQCLVAAFGVAGVVSNANALELTFGVYASERASELVEQFRPLLNVLEKTATTSLGEPVSITIKVAPTYEQGIDDLAQGRVDFARFGPASYIEAKLRQSEIAIIAMETLNGKKTFRGLICVKVDSSLTSIDQLKGKRFAFGSAESTIGRYLAQALLVHNGIHAKDLAGFEFLGRHDKVGAAGSWFV